MANKKRTVTHHRSSLGVFRLTRKDILALEDIIHRHMIERDKILRRHFKASTNKQSEELENSEYSDTYIEVNQSWLGGRGIYFGKWSVEIQSGASYTHSADSITDIPDHSTIRYLRILGKPGVYLSFSPLHTHLTVKRTDAGIEERKSMDLAIKRIKSYLTRHASRQRVLNKIA